MGDKCRNHMACWNDARDQKKLLNQSQVIGKTQAPIQIRGKTVKVKPGLEWRVTLGLRRKVSWQEPNPKFTPDGVNLKLNLKKTETKKKQTGLRIMFREVR